MEAHSQSIKLKMHEYYICIFICGCPILLRPSPRLSGRSKAFRLSCVFGPKLASRITTIARNRNKYPYLTIIIHIYCRLNQTNKGQKTHAHVYVPAIEQFFGRIRIWLWNGLYYTLHAFI